MPYSDYLPNKVAPAWMRGTWGARWWTAIGLVLDTLVTGVKNAVGARFPSTQYAASDALDALGGERILPRGNTSSGPEADASFAARLQNAWTIWSWAGTPYGLLTALATAGYPTARVMIVRGLEYTLSGGNLVQTTIPAWGGLGDVGSWLIRATRFYWSDFQVVWPLADLPTPATGAQSDWTIALPSSNSDEINALRTLIRRWRPAFARCSGMVAVTAGACYGFPFTDVWEDSGADLYGGDAVTLFTVD